MMKSVVGHVRNNLDLSHLCRSMRATFGMIRIMTNGVCSNWLSHVVLMERRVGISQRGGRIVRTQRVHSFMIGSKAYALFCSLLNGGK